MKSRRLQYAYRKSASSLHKKVGDFLRESSLFKNHKLYQEYPVKKILPSYSESSHHYDWCIPDLQIVIEVHGQQHFSPISWVGDPEEALRNLKEIQLRDQMKYSAALEAQFFYICISYSEIDSLSDDSLLEKIKLAKQELETYTKENKIISIEDKNLEYKKRIKEKRKEFLNSDEHKRQLLCAKRWRHDKYKSFKNLKHCNNQRNGDIH